MLKRFRQASLIHYLKEFKIDFHCLKSQKFILITANHFLNSLDISGERHYYENCKLKERLNKATRQQQQFISVFPLSRLIFLRFLFLRLKVPNLHHLRAIILARFTASTTYVHYTYVSPLLHL